MESLDRKTEVSTRNEQRFLREHLFKNKKMAKCGICDKEYPVAFLVAAHIKRRANCSLDEKKDYKSVVMPMCKFGCDDLYNTWLDRSKLNGGTNRIEDIVHATREDILEMLKDDDV